MGEWKSVLIGRSEPLDGICVDIDTVDYGIEIRTYNLSFNETYAYIPPKALKKIAEYYGKKPEELTDEEIVEYLVEVLKIDEKVDGCIHVFDIEW